MFDLFDIYFHIPKLIANCKLFTRSCSERPLCEYYPGATVYCTKQTHRVLKEPQCPFKLCMIDGPASLKSLCFYKSTEFAFYRISLRKRSH